MKHKLLKMTFKDRSDLDPLSVFQSHCVPFSFTNTPCLYSSCPFCLEFSFPGLYRGHSCVSFRSQRQSPARAQRGFPAIHVEQQPSPLPASLQWLSLTPFVTYLRYISTPPNRSSCWWACQPVLLLSYPWWFWRAPTWDAQSMEQWARENSGHVKECCGSLLVICSFWIFVVQYCSDSIIPHAQHNFMTISSLPVY